VNAQEVATHLVRSLVSLPDLSIRVSWLREQLSKAGPSVMAQGLEGVLNQAQSGQAEARQALLACVILLVIDRKSPAIPELAREAEALALLGLTRLLAPAADEAAPSSRPDERSVPGESGREMSVGERRALARRPTRRQLERLLADPHPRVLEMLFQCPTLTEADVLRVVTKRPVRLIAIETLTDSPRWLSRPNVRLALIQNPGCPQNIALPLLATCLRADLVSILESTTLHPSVRNAAREMLLRLPPIEPASATLQ